MFAGAEEAIFCLMNVLLGPGDHAIVTWPGLPEPVRGRPGRPGADVTLHELREADGWALDVERLRRCAPPGAPGWSSSTRRTTRPGCSRATPSGGRSRSCVPRPASICSPTRSTGILEFDPADRLAAGADALERGISLGVLSKSFALAGLRIGWLATRDRALLARVARVQGLHHDLRVGAGRDPGDRGAPGARRGPRPDPRDRRGEPAAPRPFFAERSGTFPGFARGPARSASLG